RRRPPRATAAATARQAPRRPAPASPARASPSGSWRSRAASSSAAAWGSAASSSDTALRGRSRPEAAASPSARLFRRSSTAALFVSYSGLMGGSERILLDLTSRLGHLDPVVACPPGALSDALHERGIRVFPLRRRRLELRATVRDRLEKPLRLAGQAVEVHDLVAAL